MWVIPIGVVGIIVYSEMCGRVAAVSGKAVFDAVRERVGFKAALGALVSSEVVNLMTLACELGGVAIALQLLSGLPYRWLILLAVVAFAVDHLGDVVRVARADLRLRRPLHARLRGRGGEARARLGQGRAAASSRTSRRTTRLLYAVLRGRPARRGDDAVRGLLLLLGRRRGALVAEGHRPEPGERDRRLRARRHRSRSR